MIAENFIINKDSSAECGWKMTPINNSDISFDLPENVYDAFDGKYISAEQLLNRVNTIRVAIAGCTNNLEVVNRSAFNNNSVIKTFRVKKGISTIDDMIDFCIEVPDGDNVKGAAAIEYEKFHFISMKDAIDTGNDIQAYIQTPKDNRLRCQFLANIRPDAKRNNIKYWVDDYTICSSSNGGKFAKIIGNIIEIG